MTTSGPSANWLALQKRLVRHGPPRKWRKVDGVSSFETPSSFHRNSPSASPKRYDQVVSSEDIDLKTTEVKNGESVATLRKMILGRAEYKSSQIAPGKYLALDCEMVGVGIQGSESSLARVSIVNYTGAIVLDVFVKQREKVVDYRTRWSGVRSTDLAGSAKPFKDVQQTVADLIKDRVLVGHAIYNDLKALLLSHPSPQIRDTQSLAYKHRVVKSRFPALRVLVKQELGIVIQSGEHSSVTDARATMALFRLYKKQWDSGFRPLRKVGPASIASEVAQLSPSPMLPPTRRKRKCPDSDAGGTSEKSTPSSPATHSPSPSNILDNRPVTQHISSVPPKRKQNGKSQLPVGSTQRKEISSGISTVVKRAGGIKEVWEKRLQTGEHSENSSIVRKGTKAGKKTGKAGEKWWKSL